VNEPTGLVTGQPALKELVDHLPDAAVVLADDGRVRHANPAAAELLGRPADALVGQALPARVLDLERGTLELEGVAGAPQLLEVRAATITWDGERVRLASLRRVPPVAPAAPPDRSPELLALREVARLAAEARDETELAARALEHVQAATGALVVTLERRDDAGACLTLVAGRTGRHAMAARSVPAGRRLAHRVLLRDRATLVTNLRTATDEDAPELAEAGVRTWTGVPVPTPSGSWGVLAVGHEEHGPGDSGVELLEAFAATLGAALERLQATGALAESEDRFRRLAEHAPDVLFRHGLGEGEGFTFVSPSCQVLTGFDADELVEQGWTLARLTVPEERAVVEAVLHAPEERVHLRLRWCRRDGTVVAVEVRGSVITDPDGTPVAIEGIARDVGEREAFEAELAARALHDPLTGLANRALFYDRVQQANARRHRADTRAAVLFVDLDGFKAINDSVGHEAGDGVLREIARRLRRSVRPSDTVARLGGDEFALLCEDLGSDTDALAVARRIVGDTRRPIAWGDRQLVVGASVGVAMLGAGRHPDAGADEVVRRADMAMYRAKTGGRNQAVLFDGGMADELARLLDHQQELRRSLGHDDFELHYQPVVELATGQVVGAEALLRWRHPSGVLLGPREFLAAADDAELSAALASWVLHTAAAQARAWVDLEHERAPLVSVNLSLRQFHHPELVDLVSEVLETHELEPQFLCLEVAEEVLAPWAGTGLGRLDRLRDLGVLLAVDDFGTGTSSLRRLRDLPIHRLKIDQTLMEGLGADAVDTALVRALVDLGRDLWLTVVAEGVETHAQRSVLRSFGCPQAQGFLFAAPLPAAGMTEVLKAHRIDPGPTPRLSTA